MLSICFDAKSASTRQPSGPIESTPLTAITGPIPSFIVYHYDMVLRCVCPVSWFFFADHKARPFPCNHQETDTIYTSVVTFALGLVTLTLSCFARAMISTRFREETLWAILLFSCQSSVLPHHHPASRATRIGAVGAYSAA